MIHSCLVWFLWWLRHGAIGPIEATPVGVNVDWIDFRILDFWISNSSKCNSWPYGYAPFSQCPAVPDVPGFLAKLPFYQSESVRNLQKLRFLCSFSLWGETWHMRLKATGMSFPAGVVSLVSGEVKHIVHLIRWNLKAVLCPCGWLEHGPGLA